jgi:RNA polymerase sigma-70 factor (ECF subfamily)
MAKRLVRAKEKIRDAGIPFEIPARDDLPARLSTVLDAIYAAFSEGWTDPAGTDMARRDLATETLFLGGLVSELMPDEPEALSLAALMLHAEARRPARRGASGEFIPLAEQDTALWNSQLIAEADALIRRAGRKQTLGRYELEAALQSAHAHRRLSNRNNWNEIVALYDALQAMAPSPVVAINRALAIAEVDGPGAALDAMPDVAKDQRLVSYQPFWAARAELLSRRGAVIDASQSYDMAIGLERDAAVRHFLLKRKARLANSTQ